MAKPKLRKLPPDVAEAVQVCEAYIRGTNKMPSDNAKKLVELEDREMRLLDIEQYIGKTHMSTIARQHRVMLNTLVKLIDKEKGKK